MAPSPWRPPPVPTTWWRPGSTSTPPSNTCPRSSGRPWCCVTCATSTTPRSPRCSRSRPAPFGRGFPGAGRSSWKSSVPLDPDRRDPDRPQPGTRCPPANVRTTMADEKRPDDRDDQAVQWLGVEPLDDVTRRRLVSTALRDSGASDAADPAGAAGGTRSPHAWQWLTAAAVLVVVLVVGLALLTAGGGNDEEQATRTDGTVLAPKAAE